MEIKRFEVFRLSLNPNLKRIILSSFYFIKIFEGFYWNIWTFGIKSRLLMYDFS
jgi:hypothetical protein